MGRSVVFSAFYADFCFCSKLVIITTLREIYKILYDIYIYTNNRSFASVLSVYKILIDGITVGWTDNFDAAYERRFESSVTFLFLKKKRNNNNVLKANNCLTAYHISSHRLLGFYGSEIFNKQNANMLY